MRRALPVLLLAAQLVPVWAFPYLPTHDGPSHALNALVFRELGDPRSPASAFYERRLTPIPNWTQELLLLGLTPTVPALVADKVVASLYVLGLPLALAFLLRSVGSEPYAALLGLPLVYNRCFFLGFANYCLGLVLLLLVLGEFARRPDERGRARTLWLSALLCVLYFTHLLAFLLAAAVLVSLAAAAPGPRLRRLGHVVAALAPGALLVAWYAGSSGLGPAVARSGLGHRSLQTLVTDTAGRLAAAPAALHRELFAVYAGRWPLGGLLLAVALLWATSSRLPVLSRPQQAPAGSGTAVFRWLLAAIGAAILAAFLLVPDHIGPQGVYLTTRLAPLAFLLGLAALPPLPPTRRALPIAVALLVVAVDLGLVLGYVASANRELVAFTAAQPLVAPGETLVTTRRAPGPEPLAEFRVAEYYCLASHALCLSNYEAGTGHFPVRLKPGVKQRLRENRPGSFWADVVLSWDDEESERPQPGEPYREVYGRGRLRLFHREPAMR